MERESVVLL